MGVRPTEAQQKTIVAVTTANQAKRAGTWDARRRKFLFTADLGWRINPDWDGKEAQER